MTKRTDCPCDLTLSDLTVGVESVADFFEEILAYMHAMGSTVIHTDVPASQRTDKRAATLSFRIELTEINGRSVRDFMREEKRKSAH